MKKAAMKIGGAILLIPFILILAVLFLIMTPPDYFRYKKSRYYQDTREKYSWLCAGSFGVEFYGLVKEAGLSIDCFRDPSSSYTGCSYFVYQDILIFGEYDLTSYDAEKNCWTVEIEDDYIDLKDDVADSLRRCNEYLGEERCKRAAVFIDGELYDEHPEAEYENIRLLPVRNKDRLEALKQIIR